MSRYTLAKRAVRRLPDIERHRPNLGENIRSFPIRDYRIYYRQADRGVRILHVKHARRDESGMTRK